MAKPTRKKKGGQTEDASFAALQSIESEFGDTSNIIEAATQFRQTIENPPKQKSFPVPLLSAVCALETLDVVLAPLGITGIWSVVYGGFRLSVSAYLYYWAYTNTEGIKLIGVKRKLLKGIKNKAIAACVSNAPIPFVGTILGLLPMDAAFIIMTYNDQSAAVKAIWKALGVPQKANVNITRSARKPDPDVVVNMNKGDTSQREAA